MLVQREEFKHELSLVLRAREVKFLLCLFYVNFCYIGRNLGSRMGESGTRNLGVGHKIHFTKVSGREGKNGGTT